MRSGKKKIAVLGGVGLSACFCAGQPVNAAIVSVQFGNGINSTQTAGVMSASNFNSDTTSHTYFTQETTGINNLVDSTGTVTTIAETKTDFGTYGPNGATTGFANPGDNALYSEGPFSDYGSPPNEQDFALNLTGLDPTAVYTLDLYVRGVQSYGSAALASSASDGLLVTPTYYFTAYNNDSTTYVPATNVDPTMAPLANYVEFTGLTGSSSISATIAGTQGATFDGFQLSSSTAGVPEPGTLGLFAAGSLLLLRRRRQA